MIPTLVVAAALAVGAYQPVEDAPLHKVPGPAFLIPCKVEAAGIVARVELWVSADRGKKWELYEEITPDKPAFTFVARKAGEYWFAPRIKKKDGTSVPADTADLIATQRVTVETGSGTEPAVKSSAALADELDEELTRTELELIRKEIKRLSELKELTPQTADKFDLARRRLREIRELLRRDRDPLVTEPRDGPYADWTPTAPRPALPPPAIAPPVRSSVPAPATPERFLPPHPSVLVSPVPPLPTLPPAFVPPARRPAPDEGRLPPADPLVIPTAPMPTPVRPVAPTPRVPVRPS